MRYWDKYWDSWGLISQKSGDGGDTLNRMGHWCIGSYICGDDNSKFFAFKVHKHLHNGEGIFRRHPDSSMWYSDWDRGTRDQLTPILIACGLYKIRILIKLMFRQWLRNWTFTVKLWPRNVWKDKDEHNKKSARWREWDDTTFRDSLITYCPLFIRASRCWPLYIFLFLFDCELLFGAIIKSFFAKWNKRVRGGDDINFISKLFFAKEIFPTPISWLARKVYKRRPHMRDINAGYIGLNLDYATNNGPQSALQYYCSKKDFDTYPFDLLYEDFLNKL